MSHACTSGSLSHLTEVLRKYKKINRIEHMLCLNNAMRLSIVHHHLALVKYLYYNADRPFFNLVNFAAESGDVNIMAWLHQVGENMGSESTLSA